METLFTKKEAAAYLKVSERTIDRQIDRRGLKDYRVVGLYEFQNRP